MSTAGETYYDIEIYDSTLNESGFRKFSLPLNGNNNKNRKSFMTLWHEDNSKITYCPFYKSDLDRTVKSLEDKLQSSDEHLIDEDTARNLVTYFLNQCKILKQDKSSGFFNGGNGKLISHQQQQQRRGEEYDDDKQADPIKRNVASKYSNKGKSNLHEAVTLEGGLPVFFVYDEMNGDGQQLTLVKQIEETTRIIRPPNWEEYPYESYEFANIEEGQSYLNRARNVSINTLYNKAKSIVVKYNDQDDHKLILLAADIVWSYFQDRFPTTHYIGVVGDNGSGKTTIGDTFGAIGYRVVTMTNPTAANIFRVLGKIEYGQCTIVMDEAEKIEKSLDILGILKTGSQFNGKVAKINMSSKDESQQFFHTYCMKFIIAERSPSQSLAKGVLDRTFLYTAYKGKPLHDIKEVLNPAGNQRLQKLKDELVEFRKLMLAYRLIHYYDPIADIDVGLDGRNKELCKPLLQLFYGTESYEEIRSALQKLLDAKNQNKGNLIEAALHPIITNIVSKQGNKLPVSLIWNEITSGSIEGLFNADKPNEYQTEDFDTIYRNQITKIICDKFGARKNHTRNGSMLTFDPEKLAKVGKVYDLDTNIQTKATEYSDHDDSSTGGDPNSNSFGDSGDSSDGSIEGMNSSGQNIDVENAEYSQNNHENLGYNTTNTVNDTTQIDREQPSYYQEPSQPSQPSQPSRKVLDDSSIDNEQAIPSSLEPSGRQDPVMEAVPKAASINNNISKSIYRLGHSDTWGCSNCKLNGDKPFMRQHICKGAK